MTAVLRVVALALAVAFVVQMDAAPTFANLLAAVVMLLVAGAVFIVTRSIKSKENQS